MPVHLDWRSGGNVEEILASIQSFISHVDQHNRAPVNLYSTSTGRKNGAKLMYVDDEGEETDDSGTRMWLHDQKPTMKRAARYLGSLIFVAQRLSEDISKGVMVPFREFGYRSKGTSVTKATARRLLMDLCLTVNEHPYCLGVIPEGKGYVYIAPGWEIHATTVRKMSSFLNDGDDGQGVFVDKMWGNDRAIRPLVSSLKMIRRRKWAKNIRAVIVVEHRNIQYILKAVAQREDPRFNDLMYVLTGGFADLPTREFLHMLSKDELLQDTQFLFISDRDAHAMEIFADMKYGSRNSSYCSHIAVCPQLQWAGLSIDIYRKMADRWPERTKRYFDLKHPNATENERQAANDKAEQQKNIMHERLRRPSAALTSSNKTRISHIHKNKLIHPEADKKAYEELLLMGMNRYGTENAITQAAPGELVGLTSLSRYNPYGIEEGFLAILVEVGVLSETTNLDLLPESQYQVEQHALSQQQVHQSGGTVAEEDAAELEEDAFSENTNLVDGLPLPDITAFLQGLGV